MVRKVVIALGAVAAVLVATMIVDCADAAASTALLVPSSMAFAVLAARAAASRSRPSRRGSTRRAVIRPATFICRRAAAAVGRGGGYHTTTYSAWVGVTWDYTGAVVAADVSRPRRPTSRRRSPPSMRPATRSTTS